MSDWTLNDITEKLRDIDFAILLTHTESGDIAGRPMSNNRDVEYDGDSYFFTSEHTRTVTDIERDRKVALSYRGREGLLGKPPVFITVQGEAELIRDKDEFKAHWTEDLERWFEDGVETAGLVLIKVHASRIHYWDGENEGEFARQSIRFLPPKADVAIVHYSSLKPCQCLQYRPLQERHVVRQDALIAEDLA